MRPAPVLLACALAVLAISSRAEQPTSGGLLLVANKGDHTLSLVDPDAGRELVRLEESGLTGHEVAASPDGRLAYVPIYGNSGVGQPGSDGRTIDVFDLSSRKPLTTIDLGRAERPHCAAFARDGRLFVTTELSSTITRIDARAHAIEARIPTGQPESHMMVLSRDGRRAWTSNVGAGTVSAIDLEAAKVLGAPRVAETAQRIALSIDERWLFTADQHQPRLLVIDAASMQVSRQVALPATAYGTAPTLDGRHLLAALPSARKLAVIDLRSWEVARTIDVPKAPQEVLVRPDGRVAYVSCDASAQVAEIDLAAWALARLIAVGPMADGLAWAPAPR